MTVTEGSLSAGLPYLRLGHGPPLVMASGLTAEHANPTGVMRRMSLSAVAPFAEHFTVYLTNRKVGLAHGATMSDIAGDYARAIEHDIGGPVVLHGTSTGGSVSLQLAIDRPDLVRRLVLAAAACRLSPYARQLQGELARLVQEGDPRRAWALLADSLAPGLARYPVRALAWLVGPSMAAEDPSDMLITIAAEDAFDVEPDLHRVQAPTLVVGGRRPVLLRGPLPANRRRDPRRARRDVPRQGPPVRGRLQDLGQHWSGLPARRMTGDPRPTSGSSANYARRRSQ